jgi:hypothetical protein
VVIRTFIDFENTRTHIQFALVPLTSAEGGRRVGAKHAVALIPTWPRSVVLDTGSIMSRRRVNQDPAVPDDGYTAGGISKPAARCRPTEAGRTCSRPSPHTLVETEQNREMSLTTERGNSERAGSRCSGRTRPTVRMAGYGHCTLGATQQINQYAGRRSAQRCGLLDDAPPPKLTDCPRPVHTHRLRRRHLSRCRRHCCCCCSCSCNACIAAW